MGALTVEGMNAVETKKISRANALIKLTSKPFDLNDKEQLATLQSYMNHFECSLHQMYLYQGMSTGLTTWGGSWIVGTLLPVPEFAHYFLSLFLYCGTAGHILQQFRLADFHQQLEEMKTIYNWCLKDNESVYDGKKDNTMVLCHPEIQRLLKLIAPLCTTEFMLAWPRVTDIEDRQASLTSTFSSIYSLFSQTKPDVTLNRLQDLKVCVEKREFDVGVFKGGEEAIRYFATNPHFKELIMAEIKQPIDNIKRRLPSMISGLSFAKVD